MKKLKETRTQGSCDNRKVKETRKIICAESHFLSDSYERDKRKKTKTLSIGKKEACHRLKPAQTGRCLRKPNST